MKEDEKILTYGEVLALFSFITLANNSLAPKHFRQELFDYNLKFYGILVIIGLIYILYQILFKGKK